MRLVVATGRRFEGALEHAEKLGFGGEDPVVCYGGSMVRRMNGETLLHRKIPKDLALEVLDWAAGNRPLDRVPPVTDPGPADPAPELADVIGQLMPG